MCKEPSSLSLELSSSPCVEAESQSAEYYAESGMQASCYKKWVLKVCTLVQVQRLQRYATYGHLKQLVLRLIADDVVALSEEMSDKVMALRRLFLIHLQQFLSPC